MMAGTRVKTPKFPLEPDERAVLRRAGLRLADFIDLPAEEIVRATGGALPPDRVRHLRSLALFQQLPYIGPAAAGDLVRLGYEAPPDLAGADAEEMFARLESLAGRRLDPCVRTACTAPSTVPSTRTRRRTGPGGPGRRSAWPGGRGNERG